MHSLSTQKEMTAGGSYKKSLEKDYPTCGEDLHMASFKVLMRDVKLFDRCSVHKTVSYNFIQEKMGEWFCMPSAYIN